MEIKWIYGQIIPDHFQFHIKPVFINSEWDRQRFMVNLAAKNHLSLQKIEIQNQRGAEKIEYKGCFFISFFIAESEFDLREKLEMTELEGDLFFRENTTRYIDRGLILVRSDHFERV